MDHLCRSSHLVLEEAVKATTLLRAVLVWLIIIGVETVHGILRGLLLVPVLGDFSARQVSVFTGSLLIFSVASVFFRWLRAESKQQLLFVGLMWVFLTVIFEIAVGRLVLNLSWERTTEDYDLTRGGMLGFGLLFMAATPMLVTMLRNRNDADSGQ